MSTDIVSFDILINGKAISDSTNIISIEVEQNSTKNIARVELLIDSKTQPIPVNKEFELDADIEIKLGYDSSNKTVFKGKVMDKGVRVSQGVGARNVFICEDNTPRKVSGSAKIDPKSVFDMDLGCNADKKVEGGLELQGTLNYAVGNSASLSAIIEGFPSAPIYSITHEVIDGNWLTSLHFANEEEHSKIELSTKGGNKIVLDDENNTITLQDANGSSLVFSNSGVDVKSPKDINVEATQNTTIKGDMGSTLEASGGDAQVKGVNTKITADAEASIEGSMTASVKGGTELTLKGAMVMIN